MVVEGYVNFSTQLNDYRLVHAIRKYLLREGEGLYVTDFGTAPCHTASTLASILPFLIESLRDSVQHDVAVTNSTSCAEVQERSH